MTIEDLIALLIDVILADRELTEQERVMVRGPLPALFVDGKLTLPGRTLAAALAQATDDVGGVAGPPTPPGRRLGLVGTDGAVAEVIQTTPELALVNRKRLAELADDYGLTLDAMLNVAVYEFYDSKQLDVVEGD